MECIDTCTDWIKETCTNHCRNFAMYNIDSWLVFHTRISSVAGKNHIINIVLIGFLYLFIFADFLLHVFSFTLFLWWGGIRPKWGWPKNLKPHCKFYGVLIQTFLLKWMKSRYWMFYQLILKSNVTINLVKYIQHHKVLDDINNLIAQLQLQLSF